MFSQIKQAILSLMSVYIDKKQEQKIDSEGSLFGYFDSFSKKQDAVKVGIEVEFLGVDNQTGKALPFSGQVGIEQILRRIAGLYDYELVTEKEHVIGLHKHQNNVTLEPGGQLELSAAPAQNVFEVELQIQKFLMELRDMRSKFPGIEWITVGMQPFSSLEEIEWVPKKRYDIMAPYMKTHGTQSHEMMKRTATNQVNFDYLNEEDAMEKFRVVMSLTSIVSAMFANSCISDGQPNGFMTRRIDVWNHTDPERAGLLIDFTEEGKTFRDYLNYLLDMPMLFVTRKGNVIPIKNINFRQYIAKGYEGLEATMSDFELHLSLAFPEARFKQYLEIRGVDCQCPKLIPSVAALWKGILYTSESRKKAWDLVSWATREERLTLHQEIAKKGLSASLGNKPILDIARELVEISCSSLSKQMPSDQARNECKFLERIRQEITGPGQSPADKLLFQWEKGLKKSPASLIEYLSIG